MKKDVIYIDIEDDITSIIEKVKATKEQVIALVPPKRAGVLQSVVNLKLLQRSAKADDKRLVLITSDRSLTALASGVQIPVAKNLQSKPELASVAALAVDDDDVINGDQLPIGDHANAKPKTKEELDDLNAEKALAELESEGGKAKDVKKNKKTPKGMKVPDFNKFRKWLIFGGIALVALIGFLVWAIVYAPSATITITAKTTEVNVDIPLVLTLEGESNIGSNTLRPEVQETQKTDTIDFPATGEKEVGERATGQITLRNSADSDSISVPSGTRFSSGDYTFTSSSSVTVPGARVSGGSIVAGEETVSVTAANIGADYNLPSRTYRTEVDGIAARGGNMSGGSKRTVKVVSDGDVAKAQESIREQDQDAVKNELKNQFANGAITIDESFAVNTGQMEVSPGVGEEADSAKLTVETTYTILGLKKDDVNELLDATISTDIEGRDDQRIYSNGVDDITFSAYEQSQGGGLSVRLQTTGAIGPKIEEDKLAEEVEGMRYGEIQQKVEAIRGVENVNTEFWPFWVSRAPAADKVKVEFVLSNEQE